MTFLDLVTENVYLHNFLKSHLVHSGFMGLHIIDPNPLKPAYSLLFYSWVIIFHFESIRIFHYLV